MQALTKQYLRALLPERFRQEGQEEKIGEENSRQGRRRREETEGKEWGKGREKQLDPRMIVGYLLHVIADCPKASPFFITVSIRERERERESRDRQRPTETEPERERERHTHTH